MTTAALSGDAGPGQSPTRLRWTTLRAGARRLDAWFAVLSACASLPFLIAFALDLAAMWWLDIDVAEALSEAFDAASFASCCGLIATVVEALRRLFLGRASTAACALLGANYGALSACANVEYRLRGAVRFHGSMVAADMVLCALVLGIPTGVCSALLLRRFKGRVLAKLAARERRWR